MKDQAFTLLNAVGAHAIPAAMLMSIQVAGLIAALLIADFFLRHRVRATLRCGLWMLVILKMLLPPNLLMPTSIAYWVGPRIADPIILRIAPPVQGTTRSIGPSEKWNPLPAQPLPPPTRTVLDRNAWLLLGWIFGACMISLLLFTRNRALRLLLRRSAPAPAELEAPLRAAAELFGMRRIPELRVSSEEHSPAVCGLWRPSILLPSRLMGQLTPEGWRTVFLHELTHVRRRDLWCNLAQVLVQTVWWWNPLVWFANNRIRALRETAVDEAVMLASENEEATYPATLVAVARFCSAQPTHSLSFLGILESPKRLEMRIRRLLEQPLPRRAHLGWSGWIVVLGAALSLLPMGFLRRVEAAPQPQVDLRDAKSVEKIPKTVSADKPTEPGLPEKHSFLQVGGDYSYKAVGAGIDPVTGQQFGPLQADNGAAKDLLAKLVSMRAKGQFKLIAIDCHDPQLDRLMEQKMILVLKLVEPHPELDNSVELSDLMILRLKSAEAELDRRIAQRVDDLIEDLRLRTENLYTRTFKVDPNTFIRGLEKAAGVGLEKPLERGQVLQQVRTFFEAMGVSFGPTLLTQNSERPGRALFYNDGTGILFVRASMSDLETIEKGIRILNYTPPQITLEVKWFEGPPELGATIGLVLRKTTPAVRSQSTEPSQIAPITILTDPQTRVLIRSLEKIAGVDLLSSPRVTTLAGRTAQIAVTEEKSVVIGQTNRGSGTEVTTMKLATGPSIELDPSMDPKVPNAIHVRATAQIVEFLGYEQADKPSPVIRTNKAVGSGLLWDGQTLVLGMGTVTNMQRWSDKVPVLGDIPVLGRLFRSNGTNAVPRQRFVLITPTLIDPAGNRINSTDNLPFDPSTIPPQ